MRARRPSSGSEMHARACAHRRHPDGVTPTTSPLVLEMHAPFARTSCEHRWASVVRTHTTRQSRYSRQSRGRMRSFLLLVSAGIMLVLIAVGSNMAKTARAEAHAAMITA